MIKNNIKTTKNIHETKLKILDAAEKLFALYGFETTSIRDIVQEAKLNVSLVNYHFGSKDELILAVLNRILVPLENDRLNTILDLVKKYKENLPPLDEILNTFIEPFLNLSKNTYSVKLISRTFFEVPLQNANSFSKDLLKTQQKFEEILLKSLPQLTREDLNFRMICILGMLRHILSILQSPGQDSLFKSFDDLKKRLVQYALAILKS